jgi:hypothetical protein
MTVDDIDFDFENSCLGVVATEKFPRPQDPQLSSDDPNHSVEVKKLDEQF